MVGVLVALPKLLWVHVMAIMMLLLLGLLVEAPVNLYQQMMVPLQMLKPPSPLITNLVGRVLFVAPLQTHRVLAPDLHF
jgi:hypothetical protein